MYTESSLAQFIITTLGPMASTLGWDPESHIVGEMVTDIALLYGDDIADATDMGKLRAITRMVAWKAAVQALTAYYDFQSDDERFSRSQMHKAAMASLAIAEGDAAQYGIGPHVAVFATVDYVDDPYPSRVVVDEVA